MPDCCYAAVQGVGDGVSNTVSHLRDIITDPVGVAERYAHAVAQTAKGLCKILYEMESLSVAYEQGAEQWENQVRDIVEHITPLCDALHEQIKDIPPRDLVRNVTAVATEAILGNRIRKITHQFFNSAKDQAIALARKAGEKLTNKSQVLKTAEGLQVRIADKAAKKFEKTLSKRSLHKNESSKLPAIKNDTNIVQEILEHGPKWDMPEGGKMINGRFYTKHALERMAPATKEVLEELESRALRKGLERGSKKFKDYVQPRGIPPMVIENILNSVMPIPGREPGTLEYVADKLKVITNLSGDVVTRLSENQALD